jgi:hypothetical protein
MYADEVLADDPVLYWRLGEGASDPALDSTGNGHTGTRTDATAVAGLLTGDPDGAAGLNGTSAKVETAAGAEDLQPAAFTIEAWASWNAHTSNAPIANYRPVSNEGGWSLELGAGNTVKLWCHIAGAWRSATTGALSTGTRYHLAGTFDGANLKLYVNGSQVDSQAHAGSVDWVLAGSKFGAGKNLGGFNFWLNGTVDEVAFYPSALSETRIAAHHAAGTTAPAAVGAGNASDRRLRVDVYSAAGARLGGGPLRDILGAEYRVALDELGSFSLDLPAEDERAGVVTQGCVLWLYVQDEGLVFRGIVDRRRIGVRADGSTVVTVEGSSLGRQLAWANTKLGLAFQGTTLANTVGDDGTAGTLLHGTGWAPGTVDAPATTLLSRFDGLSIWAALAKVAEIFRLHVREDSITLSGGSPVSQVDVSAFGASSGIVLKNITSASPNLRENPNLYPVAGVEVDEDGGDLWNSVIPLGAGEGVNKLDLQYATRASPYAVSSAAGPDGRTYYYLEDAASVASYGRRQRVLSVKEAIPLANSLAGFQAAANALYDVAATELVRGKDPLIVYSVDTVGLTHVAAGSPRFQPGDKVRLQYHGVATDRDGGARAWLTVDQQLWLLGFTRRFAADGSDQWTLDLATVDRQPADPGAKVADAFEDLFALQVAVRPYTYRENHSMTRQSITSGKTATLVAKFDGNVNRLHQAKLTFKVQALRSNVTTIANDGGQVPTSSSGGAQTSSGGSSHTHSVSGQTATADGNHRHKLFRYSDTQYSGDSTGASSATNSGNQLADHTHTETGTQTGVESVDHQHNIAHTHTQIVRRQYVAADSGGTELPVYLAMAALGADVYTHGASATHTHSVSATTSGAETSHTHTVTNHTHTVTIAAHNHALQYGIYDASAPVNPAITLNINGTDRTAALGGPWNTVGSEVELDVSAYLVDANGQVLRQSNTLTFGAGVLCDVEATLRSLVTASSLIPV